MERTPLRRTHVADELRAEIARQRVSYVKVAQAADISVDTLRRRLDGVQPFFIDELDSITNLLNVAPELILARARTAEEAAREANA